MTKFRAETAAMSWLCALWRRKRRRSAHRRPAVYPAGQAMSDADDDARHSVGRGRRHQVVSQLVQLGRSHMAEGGALLMGRRQLEEAAKTRM